MREDFGALGVLKFPGGAKSGICPVQKRDEEEAWLNVELLEGCDVGVMGGTTEADPTLVPAHSLTICLEPLVLALRHGVTTGHSVSALGDRGAAGRRPRLLPSLRK